MFQVVAGLLAGAWLVNRQRPHTNVEKRSILGPRTGRTYECDEFPETGMVIVHDPATRSQVVFRRGPGGFHPVGHRGHPAHVQRILHDMQASTPKTPARVDDDRTKRAG